MYTITITDTTEATTTTNGTTTIRDAPEGYNDDSDRPLTITFTITVQQAVATSRGLTFVDTTTNPLQDTIVGTFGIQPISVTVSGSTANARVEFEITKGPGSLSAENTIGSKTSKRLSTLTGTGGIATVTLDPKKGTNHVRAWIYGNPAGTEGKSTEGIYIYGWAILNKVSGDSGDPQQNQKGPINSRLEEPFIVQLFDSTERTTILGAKITFAATGGTLAKDPSFPSNLYPDDFPTTSTVTTDSNGKANVFLVLGASGEQSVTATYSTETETFEASIRSGTSTAQSIRKVAGTDGQTADEYGALEEPLTVVVRDQGGRRFVGQIVRFVALDGGTLDYEPDDPGGLKILIILRMIRFKKFQPMQAAKLRSATLLPRQAGGAQCARPSKIPINP